MRAKNILVITAAMTLLSSCKLMTNYKFDTTANHLADKTLMEYVNSGKDTTLSLCAEAFQYTGIANLLEEEKNMTVLLPNNFALRNFYREIGIGNVTEMAPNILKQLFLYCILPEKCLSYNLGTDLVSITTLSGDPMYWARLNDPSDKYHIVVNKNVSGTEDDIIIPNFGSKQFSPKQQDMIFKDHVAHVCDMLPLFVIKSTPTDQAPERTDAALFKWEIAGDTHIYPSSKTGYAYFKNKVSCSRRTSGSQTRTGLLLFEKQEIGFDAEDITSARLHVFPWNNSTKSPVVTTLSIYDQSFIPNRPPIMEITKHNFKPQTDEQYLKGKIENLPYREWVDGDITEYVKEFYKDPSQTELLMALAPPPEQKHAAGGIDLGYLDEETNYQSNPSFITIQSTIKSELEVINLKDTECEKNSILTLDENIIMCSGKEGAQFEYADNNILYALDAAPELGFLTRNGIPLKEGVNFTQEELKNGMIKYYCKMDVTGEEILKLRISDYTLGSISEPVSIKILIK